MERVWKFETARFVVALEVEEIPGYQYDGDDENGETQAALDSGEYIAFDSRVVVTCDGVKVGSEYLGSSVYGRNEWREFFTAHRDPDPMNRNCSIMRAERGQNVSICHYFPSMVLEAVSVARQTLRNMPELRK